MFEENLVLASGRKACTGLDDFLPGHGDVVRNNRCIVGLETISSTTKEHIELAGPRDSKGELRDRLPDNIGYMTCKNGNAVLYNNSYFTPHGNASISCRDLDQEISFTDLQDKYGFEKGSTVSTIPPVKSILQWANAMLIAGDEQVSR